jgi:hypothetical protein
MLQAAANLLLLLLLLLKLNLPALFRIILNLQLLKFAGFVRSSWPVGFAEIEKHSSNCCCSQLIVN